MRRKIVVVVVQYIDNSIECLALTRLNFPRQRCVYCAKNWQQTKRMIKEEGSIRDFAYLSSSRLQFWRKMHITSDGKLFSHKSPQIKLQ